MKVKCADALGRIGGRTSTSKLEKLADGFFTAQPLKQSARRALDAIDERLAAGVAGALAVVDDTAEGGLSPSMASGGELNNPNPGD